MADGWKASCVASHGVVDGKCSSAAACLWCVLELPVVSEAKLSREWARDRFMVRDGARECNTYFFLLS